MAKYVFLYGGGQMATTDAERATQMKLWMDWFGTLGPAIVDGGNPFGAEKSVSSRGVSDAAVADVSGYSIVAAENLDAAAKLAKGCPVLTSGGRVDILETLDVM
jgi:hypothetical protein